MSQAANYSVAKAVVDGIEVVKLADAAHHTEVAIVPSIGNNAYEMKVNGKNVLWNPFEHLREIKTKPAQFGNPFLWPWANRIDQDAYYANGKKYLLNAELGNFRKDANQKPIHGNLVYSALWHVAKMEAGADSALVTSRLEFWKHPDLMAQFPFAHTVEMTYRLANGVLEVETALLNHSVEPMPVSLGYHTYYRIHDVPRDQWKVHIAAKERLKLSAILIPTGEHAAVEGPDPAPLMGAQLDDVFGGLRRGADGRATFFVQGKKEKIAVIYGPKYTTAVIYAPSGREFICFEPMSAVTNAFNLAHAGVVKDLQSVPPGGEWRESFWISPSGF